MPNQIKVLTIIC